MKKATISAAAAGEAAGFAWTWRCADDGRSSERSFVYYFDCLTDAREHGYEVDLAETSGIMAPSGPHYRIRAFGD